MKLVCKIKKIARLMSRPFDGTAKNAGMTLIEIIIVVALLGTLMAYMVSSFVNTADQARVDQTKLAMGNISQQLQIYRVHHHKYPSTEEGLNALVENPSGSKKWRGPYIERKKLVDPWGQDFTYESDGGKDFKILSPGLNGQMGDEDDITYPEDDTKSSDGEGGGDE